MLAAELHHRLVALGLHSAIVDYVAQAADAPTPPYRPSPPPCYTISSVGDLTVNIGFPGDGTSLEDIAAAATTHQTTAHHHCSSLSNRPGKY